jgi:hypothetical protein
VVGVEELAVVAEVVAAVEVERVEAEAERFRRT